MERRTIPENLQSLHAQQEALRTNARAMVELIAHEAQVGNGGFPGLPAFRGRCLPGSAGILPAWTARGLQARVPGKASVPGKPGVPGKTAFPESPRSRKDGVPGKTWRT